ncbi:hypothetical protein ACJZ2D_011891 [Fusarium nematophilum]
MASHRQYEITVFGATGWTATVCAEHILDAAGLDPIVCDTHVLINGIGPYHRHGTPVVKACARNGTHYVDFSTETAWIAEMVRAYHELAQELGAVIIPATSGSSSPSDLVAWLIARCLKDKGLPPASEVVCSGKLNMLGMQGGSLHTVLDVAENYGIGGWLNDDSWVMSSAPKPPRASRASLLGHQHDPILGHLGTSQSFDPGSGPDREESRKAESAEWRAAGYVEGKKDLVVVASFGY